MATNRKLSWSNAREVRRSLAAINNMLLNKTIEPDRARAIIYGANNILASIRTDEQEKQIEELRNLLEEVMEDRKNERY